MWDELDSYCLMVGEPLRPMWRDAPYRPWFAWRPVKTDAGWAWLRTVSRRRRRAYRRTFGPFGPLRPSIVDYRELIEEQT